MRVSSKKRIRAHFRTESAPFGAFPGTVCILIAVSIAALILWLLPWQLAFAVVTLVAFVNLFDWWRFRKRAASREDDAICSFARSFDFRRIDTLIIRAVYEELQAHCGVPLRTTDRLRDDLRIDPEDLEDVAEEISRLTGRSVENSERNPYYDRVKTAGDLVLFFSHQPLINAAEFRPRGENSTS